MLAELDFSSDGDDDGGFLGTVANEDVDTSTAPVKSSAAPAARAAGAAPEAAAVSAQLLEPADAPAEPRKDSQATGLFMIPYHTCMFSCALTLAPVLCRRY